MKIMTNQNDCRGKFTLFLVALVILWGHQPGFSETQDIEQLRKAAEQGDAETQFSLGRIYSLGRGVPSGRAKRPRSGIARRPSRDTPGLQIMLGHMYARGEGVP